MSDDRKPDALYIPVGFSRSPDPATRVREIGNYAKGVLGTDKAVVRSHQGGPVHFVSASGADTILFPTEHERAKEDRYDWDADTQDNGVRFGYLKADA